jgi:protoporphyrinogen oxidase
MQEKSVTFTNGHTQSYDILISTLPLDRFIEISNEKSASNYKKALPHLLCNSVMNFNLGFSRNDISDKHWIYFPEKEFPFYRVGFPHNFSTNVVPNGCGSLYGEYAYIQKSSRWLSETTKQAIAHIKKVLNISNNDVITEKIIPISHAYVIYDQWRDKNLNTLLNELQKEHVYSIGRYGAWKYSSMQEAVLDGKNTAELVTIIPAKRMFSTSLSNTISHEPQHEINP